MNKTYTAMDIVCLKTKYLLHVHYRSKVLFLFLNEVSSAHQGCFI